MKGGWGGGGLGGLNFLEGGRTPIDPLGVERFGSAKVGETINK